MISDFTDNIDKNHRENRGKIGKDGNIRALPIFNFYRFLRIFYGYIDWFQILKIDFYGF